MRQLWAPRRPGPGAERCERQEGAGSEPRAGERRRGRAESVAPALPAAQEAGNGALGTSPRARCDVTHELSTGERTQAGAGRLGRVFLPQDDSCENRDL